MVDDNIAVARRWIDELWNKARREAIDEMLAPDALLHEGETTKKGPESLKPLYDRMRSSFSDVKVKIEDVIAQDDKVCLRTTSSMKHTGAGLGMAATGKNVTVTGVTILRIKNGKIVEGWHNWDMMTMMQQIQGAPMAATFLAAAG